jgi:molybdopterin molybdotransferase
VLARDVVSSLDVPPADNSAMDGYALRLADLAGPGAMLPLSQRITAGHVGEPLRPGSARAHLHRPRRCRPGRTRS